VSGYQTEADSLGASSGVHCHIGEALVLDADSGALVLSGPTGACGQRAARGSE
jgi:hypothetical protein